MPQSVLHKAQRWSKSFLGFLESTIKDAAQSVRSWSVKRWLTVLAAIIAVAAFFFFVDIPDLASLREAAHTYGDTFLILFWLGYVFFTLFPIPRTIWTVGAGILFGPWLGLGLALTALTVSAVIALLGVRLLLGEWMRPHLQHPAVAGLDQHLARRGWLAIASLRMVGAVPFSVVNYAAGLTSVPVGQFAAATALGSIPTTALGVFFGDALVNGSNPWLIAAMVVFAMIGIGGLVLDSRLAHRESQAPAVD